jgi:hypothetical protein
VMLDLIIVLAPLLCGVLILAAARDQAQVPSKPPTSPVIRIQAQRGGKPRRPLYGTPDISKQEEDAA